MVVLKVNGQKIKFLVDTGATVSCIQQNFPLSSKTLSITGCVGEVETKTYTEPLAVTLNDQMTQHEFIYLPNCNISICGRDLMCKLSLSIICCPDGHKVLNKEETIQMLRTIPRCRNTKILYLSPDVAQDSKSQVTIFWAQVLTDPDRGNIASQI